MAGTDLLLTSQMHPMSGFQWPFSSCHHSSPGDNTGNASSQAQSSIPCGRATARPVHARSIHDVRQSSSQASVSATSRAIAATVQACPGTRLGVLGVYASRLSEAPQSLHPSHGHSTHSGEGAEAAYASGIPHQPIGKFHAGRGQ